MGAFLTCLTSIAPQRVTYLGRWIFFVLVPVLLLGTASTLCAATVTATWNANPESNIAGYKLRYGTTSGTYTTTTDVGNVTSTVVTVNPGQTYYFVVQAYDTLGLVSPNSAEVSFTVAISSAPTLLSLSPTAGSTGTVITISGSGFAATQGTSTVTFNGTTAAPTSWSATSIVVPVPVAATTGNVVVTVGGLARNALTFTVTAAPTFTSLAPTGGAVGT